MKRFFLLITLFLPLIINAQGVEYGIGGGISTNTAPLSLALPSTINETGWKPSYAGNVTFLLNLGPWQVGITAEAYEIKTTRDIVTTLPEGDVHTKTNIEYASPQVPILLQINRVFYMHKSNIYFGLSGWSGVNLLKNAAGEIKYNELQPVFGAQLGYTLGLSDLIGINANLAARYNAIPGNPILSFPLTIGIRIRP